MVKAMSGKPSINLHGPIYFPCPTCGRPVDALNKPMMDGHAKFHADEFIRSLEAGK